MAEDVPAPQVDNLLGVVMLGLAVYLASPFLPPRLVLLLWGALAVGLLDNILRPVLIGRGAKLPIFLLFLGIFGGLKVYGPIGILLGPLLVSCVQVFLQIYRETKNMPHPAP